MCSWETRTHEATEGRRKSPEDWFPQNDRGLYFCLFFFFYWSCSHKMISSQKVHISHSRIEERLNIKIPCKMTIALQFVELLQRVTMITLNRFQSGVNSHSDGDFCHQRRDTEIGCTTKLRLSKPTDMTIHWKALDEHFLVVPLVFWFNHFRGENSPAPSHPGF
jgi:hypothetical protein